MCNPPFWALNHDDNVNLRNNPSIRIFPPDSGPGLVPVSPRGERPERALSPGPGSGARGSQDGSGSQTQAGSGLRMSSDAWVCPNDRQLALRAK